MQEFEKSVRIWEKTAWICFPASWFLVSHTLVLCYWYTAYAGPQRDQKSYPSIPISACDDKKKFLSFTFFAWFSPENSELAVTAAFNVYCLPDIVSLKIQPVPINSINVDMTQAKKHTCHFFIQSCANMYLPFHRNVQSFLKVTLSTEASVFSWAI